MLHRRRFLQMGSLGAGTFFSQKLFAKNFSSNGKREIDKMPAFHLVNFCARTVQMFC